MENLNQTSIENSVKKTMSHRARIAMYSVGLFFFGLVMTTVFTSIFFPAPDPMTEIAEAMDALEPQIYSQEAVVEINQQALAEAEADLRDSQDQLDKLRGAMEQLIFARDQLSAEAEMGDLEAGNFVPTGPNLQEFLNANASESFKDAKVWTDVADHYGLKHEILPCIAQADSSLGKSLKSKNNVGNVGNNDRGDVVEFATPDTAIEAIAKTLHNTYLGGYTKLGELSVGGGNTTGPVYATSKFNWNKNVKLCVSNLKGHPVDESWEFRQ